MKETQKSSDGLEKFYQNVCHVPISRILIASYRKKFLLA